MSREIKIAENALEVMNVLHEMIDSGELPSLDKIYEDNNIGFSELKDEIVRLAENFERENIKIDWNEKNYAEEIGEFARKELFMIYGEKQVFYTESWDTYDIIAAADMLEVSLNKDEIDKVVKRVKMAFDNKSGRNEIIMDIVESVVKTRKDK